MLDRLPSKVFETTSRQFPTLMRRDHDVDGEAHDRFPMPLRSLRTAPSAIAVTLAFRVVVFPERIHTLWNYERSGGHAHVHAGTSCPTCLRRHPVPERGRQHRPVRQRSLGSARRQRHLGRGDRRRQRLDRRERGACGLRGSDGRARAAARATAAPTSPASRPRRATTSSWPTPT